MIYSSPRKRATIDVSLVHQYSLSRRGLSSVRRALGKKSVLDKLKLLEKSTRTDIAYTMHQCDCFYQDLRASHGDAIIHLVKYLKATKMQGIMIDPEGSKSSKVYSDADFCRKCHRPTAGDDPSNAKSWTGYNILYAGIRGAQTKKTKKTHTPKT